MAISIIVADDHPLTRSGLAGFIRENGACALLGEAEDGVQAWELIREHMPDIALLDIRMPGEDGVAVTRRIRASGLRTRVIMLTSYDATFPAVAVHCHYWHRSYPVLVMTPSVGSAAGFFFGRVPCPLPVPVDVPGSPPTGQIIGGRVPLCNY